MDILTKRFTTNLGVTNLLVIFDRLTKLVRAIPLDVTTAVDISKAINSNRDFTFEIQKSVLIDSGTQFNAKLLQQVHRVL